MEIRILLQKGNGAKEERINKQCLSQKLAECLLGKLLRRLIPWVGS
jgi:hypothetical protein